MDIILQAETLEVKGDGVKMTGLQYKNRQDVSIHDLAVAGTFVQIGLLPNTHWLDGIIARNAMQSVKSRLMKKVRPI